MRKLHRVIYAIMAGVFLAFSAVGIAAAHIQVPVYVGAQVQATQNCPNPLTPGVTFGGTTIAGPLSVKGPEGGIIHEIRAGTNFEIGNCPPIKGEISYRLEIKVRRGLKFRWIPVGTLEKKDVSNLPPGTKFRLNSRRHCNPHGHASFRVYVHAAAGINGDGSPSPPETRFLPTPKGKYKACR